jgi:ABC-type lipoprotein release transport system permease subunit
VSFAGLVLHNLKTRRLRTALTAFAVAVGVMTVVTLAVVTQSLRTSAAAVLRTGKADFAIAQKSSPDLLDSVLDERQVARLSTNPGVESVVGVLLGTTNLNRDNPLFIEIGISPDKLAAFGVTVVAGQPYTATATDQIMLGSRAADSLGKHVGDTLTIEHHPYRVVGIFSTGPGVRRFGLDDAAHPPAGLRTQARQPHPRVRARRAAHTHRRVAQGDRA